MNKLAEAFRDERRKNRALDEKLKKYRSAVESLREQLEDLNLFNAKLLYVNKLLQNKNLNEAEKKSVIKALDEAKSLNEAKSLFKSLTETFARGNAKPLTESRNRGSSSRPTTSSAPKQGNAPELDRWQRLAGLK
jgi:DNA repair exonuclease SbcCD ATPase subunit